MNDANDYSDRVRRVVGYLAEHLDDTLELDVLARVACFSPYHFHRVYRALLCECPPRICRPPNAARRVNGRTGA